MTASRATKLGLLPNVPSGKRDGHGDCWQAMPCTCLPSPLFVPVALIYFSLFCLSYLETQLPPSNVNRQGNCHGIGIRGNVGHACNPSGQGPQRRWHIRWEVWKNSQQMGEGKGQEERHNEMASEWRPVKAIAIARTSAAGADWRIV